LSEKDITLDHFYMVRHNYCPPPSFKWHQLPIRLLATYLYLTVISISVARCKIRIRG